MKKINNFSGKKRKKLEGFSLMELIISMFIMVLVIVTSVSVFSNVILTREKTRETQRNLEEARTALEIMSKNLRMSRMAGFSEGKMYMYNNSQNICIAYEFSGGGLLVGTGNPASLDPYDAGYLDCSATTASENLISGNFSGSFYMTPTSASSPKEIGRATVAITSGSGNDLRSMETTVSFRDYDDVFPE